VLRYREWQQEKLCGGVAKSLRTRHGLYFRQTTGP